MSIISSDQNLSGNHEFDNGVESFVDHFIENVTDTGTGQTAFPILSCNIDSSYGFAIVTVHKFS